MRVSESYVIGVDIDNNEDESMLTVCQYHGNKVAQINLFIGEEAEWMYKKLIGEKERKK